MTHRLKPRRHRRICGLWLAPLAIVAVIALPVAAAQADATWTGAVSSEWSVAGNWTGTPPAMNSAAGTLTFPDLGSCSSCTTDDDLPGVSATGLAFTNASSTYSLTGDNSLTVGNGGISTGGGSTGDVIHAPLDLSATQQTWTVGSAVNGYNSLTLLGGITGGSTGVITRMPAGGDLFVDSDMEVGNVTSDGPGGFHIGSAPILGTPNSASPGAVDASDGGSLTIAGGKLIANPNSKTGPLAINSGTLLLGTNPNNDQATTLHVNGTATLTSSTTTTTFINGDGSTPGTDFSQLSASGPVTLAGTLLLSHGVTINRGCASLDPGQVATLVTAGGGLTGTYSNAPNGAILTLGGACPSAEVQINYTANSVTATVVTGATQTTTILATPNPSVASTDQPVTLTATVTTNGSAAPSGTVAFSANGAPIAGCMSQPIAASGSSGTATCTASFAATDSPVSLTAVFTGSVGSGQAGSTTAQSQSLTVNRGSTATVVAASNDPRAGASVTYTAAVTSNPTGATIPSGTVAFLDDGSPIPGCSARPLAGGSTTCAVSYTGPGTHSINAVYGGDSNFTGSISPATSVTVQGPRTISAATSKATHIRTTRATLTGSVSPIGPTVSWKFEYGRGKTLNRATRLQKIRGGSHAAVSVSALVKGLSPNVRYHYRLVVFSQTSRSPVARGKDLTFTTEATGRLLGPTRQISTRRGKLRVRQSCQSTVLCAGSFSLVTTVRTGRHRKRSTVVCATGSFRIKAHGTAIVRPRLSAACSKLLRAATHHRLTVMYAAESRTGQIGLRQRITLVLG
jgi:large repetitive protein